MFNGSTDVYCCLVKFIHLILKCTRLYFKVNTNVGNPLLILYLCHILVLLFAVLPRNWTSFSYFTGFEYLIIYLVEDKCHTIQCWDLFQGTG